MRKIENIKHVSGKNLLRALAIGAALALALGLMIGFAIRPLIPALTQVNWLSTIIVSFVYLSLIVGHLIVFGGWRGVASTFQIGAASWNYVGKAFLLWVLVWLLMVPVYFLLSPVYGPLGNVFNGVLKIGALYGYLHNAGLVFILLGLLQTVVLSPFAEELIFRGSVLGWLSGRYKMWPVIIISSVLFALYHPMPILWPMAFMFGVAAAWIRIKSNSLTPFLLMHAFNSVVMIMASYFVTGWNV